MAARLAAAPAMAAMFTLTAAGGASAAPAAPAAASSGVTNIPVLSYHQLDNGCAKTDALCDPPASPAAKAPSRLQALPRSTWSFAFHAGAQGHSVTYPDNPGVHLLLPVPAAHGDRGAV